MCVCVFDACNPNSRFVSFVCVCVFYVFLSCVDSVHSEVLSRFDVLFSYCDVYLCLCVCEYVFDDCAIGACVQFRAIEFCSISHPTNGNYETIDETQLESQISHA